MNAFCLYIDGRFVEGFEDRAEAAEVAYEINYQTGQSTKVTWAPYETNEDIETVAAFNG